MAEAKEKPVPKVHVCKKCSGIDVDKMRAVTGIKVKYIFYHND